MIHYPKFNVMTENEHWDKHTRSIVENRLKTSEYVEDEFSYKLISLLLDDIRIPIINYVISHIKKQIKSDIGESQRKKGTPPFSYMFERGLPMLNDYCIKNFNSPFNNLNQKQQFTIIETSLEGSTNFSTDPKFTSKTFLKHLLQKSIDAYYSHPTIWSEIGYAGPTYPRGYVRSEWGLTDPWEAKRDESS